MFNFPSNNFPKVRLGLLRRRRLQWGQALRLEQSRGRALQLGQTWRLPLGKLYIWEVANRENTLGKVPLGKIPLGSSQWKKKPWEVAALNKAFGKVPNIVTGLPYEEWAFVSLLFLLIFIQFDSFSAFLNISLNKFSFCHKLCFSNPYIFESQCRRS